MKGVIATVGLTAAVVVLSAAGARAELPAGQPAPEITASDWLNSPPLSLAKLRGRIAVVEFWATWCPPCRTSIPHLVELYKKYGPQGVVIMGLTDEPRSKVEGFASSMNMIYPVGCGSTSSRVYGVRGIPHAFVVDVAGKIAWHGHPMDGGFETAIQAELQKNPPTLMSPGDKAAALSALDKAEEALKKDQPAVAAALAARVKDADQDPEVKKRAEAVRAALAERATARMADAEKHLKAKAHYEASLALGDVMVVAAGSDLATQARGRLAELLKDDQIRAAIEQGKREKEAADLLAAIEADRDKKAPAELLAAYDDLANRLADTQAGKTAADKAKAMRADKGLMARIQTDAADTECAGWLSMARNFLKSGMPDKARPYLEKVIEKYPDTEYAKEARDLLAKVK